MQNKKLIFCAVQSGFKISIEYTYFSSPKAYPVYFKVEIPSDTAAGGSQIIIITVKQFKHDGIGYWYTLYVDNERIGDNIGSYTYIYI